MANDRALTTLLDFYAPRHKRTSAAQALGQFGDEGAIPPMIDLLGRTSGRLRRSIEESLRKLGAPGLLVETLRTGNDAARERAALQLVLLPVEESVEPLMEATRADPSARVRENAIGALAQSGASRSAEVVAALVDRLQRDEDLDVRSAAAQALGRTGTEDARAALADALRSEPDEFVAFFIKKAIRASAGA